MVHKLLSILRGIFFSNKQQKLIALLLAVVSWYAIREAISNQRWITNVPLTVEVDDGLAILDQSSGTVDVLFQGSQLAIQSLDREHVEVSINNRGKTVEDAARITIEPKHIRALGGARPVEIRPDVIELTLDQEEEAQLPVKVAIEGEPPAGYEVESMTSSPASVRVYGPKKRLQGVGALRTEVIDLRGRVRSFQLSTAVAQPSDRWSARIEPSHVTVEVVLVEHSSSQELLDVKVRALITPELAPKVTLWPAKVNVVLSGRADLVETAEKTDVKAYVDCSGLEGSATYELPVQVHALPGFEVKEITPDVVEVEIDGL